MKVNITTGQTYDDLLFRKAEGDPKFDPTQYIERDPETGRGVVGPAVAYSQTQFPFPEYKAFITVDRGEYDRLKALAHEVDRQLTMRERGRNYKGLKLWERQILDLAQKALGTRKPDAPAPSRQTY